MKKIFACMIFACLLLTGCGEAEVVIEPSESALPETAEPESAAPELTADIIPAEPEEGSETPAEESEPESYLDIDPRDEFMNYGYTHFMAENDETYLLRAENTEELEWCVYLLDEEFTDAERYIPQVYEEVFSGVGNVETEISAKAGQWVYIYCGANGWTGIEVPDGAHMRVSTK